MSDDDRKEPTRAARIAIADTARGIRARFRASRRSVDPNIDEMVAQRRVVITARHLTLLTDSLLATGTTAEAKAEFTRMTSQIVDARARQLAS